MPKTKPRRSREQSPLAVYLAEIARTPLLTVEEERELAANLKSARNEFRLATLGIWYVLAAYAVAIRTRLESGATLGGILKTGKNFEPGRLMARLPELIALLDQAKAAHCAQRENPDDPEARTSFERAVNNAAAIVDSFNPKLHIVDRHVAALRARFAPYLVPGAEAPPPELIAETCMTPAELTEKLRDIEFAKKRYESYRRELAGRNVRLAVSIAKQARGQLPLGEAISAANEGLLEAAQRFDPDFKTKFSTYAPYWIKQTLRIAVLTRHTRRLPLYIIESMAKYRKTAELLEASLGRKPTHEEIAAGAGLKPKCAARVAAEITLSDKAKREREAQSPDPNDLKDTRESHADHELNLAEIREQLAELPSMELRVLTLVYGLDGSVPRKMKGAALELNVARETVKKICEKAESKLRAAFA